MKYVFITGAAGGLGGAVARDLADNGYTVFVADINQKALDNVNHKNMITVQVDICNDESIAKAKEVVLQHTDELHAVINVAGILTMSSMAEGDVKMLERMININMLGMFRINQAFLPLIIKGKGRILNFSSEIGWLSAAPFNGMYGVSKRAVEMYSDTLRRELNYIGVPVVKIQPGSFKTEMHVDAEANFQKLLNSTTYFKEQLSTLKPIMVGELKHANDPKYLVAAVHKAVECKKPKRQYRVKNSPKLRFLNIFSEGMIDKIYIMVLSVLGKLGIGKEKSEKTK